MIQLKCPHCAKDIRAADEQAGKRVRCPGCKEVLTVPAAPTAVQAAPKPKPPASKRATVDEEPIVLVPATDQSADDEDERPRRRSRQRDEDDDDDDRPRRRRDRRREDDDEDDDDRPRRKRDRRDDDDDEDDRPRRRRSRRRGNYADCPNCDAPGDASPVTFTWWGGLLGPRMFSHVRCNECGTCYNGKSGKSNNTAIAIYVGVSLVLSLFILGCGVIAAILEHH